MRLIVFSTSEINLPSSNDYLVPSNQRFITDYSAFQTSSNDPKTVFDLEGMQDIYVYDFDDEFLQSHEYHKWSKDAFVEQVLKTSWAWDSKDKELGKYGHGYLDNPDCY